MKNTSDLFIVQQADGKTMKPAKIQVDLLQSDKQLITDKGLKQDLIDTG